MGPTPTHRLAIDLGTCHTVAVVRRGDEAPRALLFDGSPVMPSGIYADEQGRLSVGRDAERLSQLAPERFEPYPKRSVDEGSVLLGAAEVTVVEMLAALLRRAAEESLQAGVNPVGSTVLTCPADWGGQRRGVLLEAARAASLGPVVLVDEPIAAATYCLRVLGQQVAPLQSLAVFDFGGGTLDVSVVRREFDGLRVLGVGGLDDLGGVDIDAALVGHLGQLINLRHPQLWQRLANPDSTAAKRDRRELWTEVRAAKEMLSRAASAPVHLPGTDEALHLTREELERVAGPLIDRAVDETRRVLERAGVDPRQLAGIFLVGGSSRIPLVASRLHARFGVAPVVPEQPELPVAYGGMLAVEAGAGAATPQPPFAGSGGPQTAGTGFPVSGVPVSPGASYPASGVSPGGSFPGAGISPGGSYPASGVSPGGSYPAAGVSPGTSFPVSSAFPAAAPASPAAGPGSPAAGPVSAPSGAQPPYSQQHNQPPHPQPPRMGSPLGSPATAPPGSQSMPPGPPAYGVGVPVVVRERRRRTAPWIALVVVLAVIGGCVYGGNRFFGWVGDQFESVKNGFPGLGDGTDGPGKVDGLKAGEVIQLSSDGAIAATAGNGSVYTAQVNAGATVVAGYETTGKQTWTVQLQAEPAELALKVVGNLLIVDGKDDAKLGGDGKQESRSVIDLATHTAKWTQEWNDRIDLVYLGTDVVVEHRDWNKPSTDRVNLLDGKTRWSAAVDKSNSRINGDRGAKPALTWPTSDTPATTIVPTYGLTFSSLWPFQESLTGGAFAVQLQSDTKAATLDLATGKQTASGAYKKNFSSNSWIVFNDLAMFKGEADGNVVAYDIRSWKLAWEYKAASGTKVDNLRPCGEKLVCVAGTQTSGKDVLIAIDAATGQAKWTRQSVRDRSGRISGTEDPILVVLDGKLVGGHGVFDTVGDAAVLDPATGNDQIVLGQGLASQNAYAGYGNKVVIESVVPGDGTWNAYVYGLDGKPIGSGNVPTLLQDVSLSNDSVVLLDKDKAKVYRFQIPAGK